MRSARFWIALRKPIDRQSSALSYVPCNATRAKEPAELTLEFKVPRSAVKVIGVAEIKRHVVAESSRPLQAICRSRRRCALSGCGLSGEPTVNHFEQVPCANCRSEEGLKSGRVLTIPNLNRVPPNQSKKEA
jgi:hypothetical protein